jgi:hypothetical protein
MSGFKAPETSILPRNPKENEMEARVGIGQNILALQGYNA